MSRLVSVIMPAYNAEAFIAQAIESVLAQTYPHWELIVVNDGSTDNTVEIVSSFVDPRILYIFQENRGLSGARNTGIRAAQSDIIALLDSDDLWLPEFLEKMKPLIDQHLEAAAVYCGFRYIDEQGREIGNMPSIKVVEPDLFHKTMIFDGSWLVPCAVLFRKQLAVDIGLFDESLRAVEDTDLWHRLSTHHVFVGLPQALVKYRRHDSNMTNDPQHMLTALQSHTEKMFGPLEGDKSSWTKFSLFSYAKLFRVGTRRYLAHGNIPESARYYLELLEIMSDMALDMGFWRTLSRVHLPVEYRDDPSAKLDWRLVERDILGLLGELEVKTGNSNSLKKKYSSIKGAAFLALADEAVRGNDFNRSCIWLRQSATCFPKIFLLKPFWGTVTRNIIKMIKIKISNINKPSGSI